jgi:alkaline ceramidase TOD1/glycosyltransferase MUCI70-like protein
LELIVYTAVFGLTDPLSEPAAVAGARFVCFTDQTIKSKRWEIVQMDRQEAPTRTARTLKLSPHHLFPEADASLWMDACFTLKTPVGALLDEYLQPITTFRHKDRTRIVEEAHQIAKLGKAKPITTFRQLSAYQSEGFDTVDNPMQELSCNGVILRRHNEKVAAFNELWTRQIEQHTLRDQMSADYVAWRLGITLGRWEGAHNTCPHFGHKQFKRPVNDY